LHFCCLLGYPPLLPDDSGKRDREGSVERPFPTQRHLSGRRQPYLQPILAANPVLANPTNHLPTSRDFPLSIAPPASGRRRSGASATISVRGTTRCRVGEVSGGDGQAACGPQTETRRDGRSHSTGNRQPLPERQTGSSIRTNSPLGHRRQPDYESNPEAARQARDQWPSHKLNEVRARLLDRPAIRPTPLGPANLLDECRLLELLARISHKDASRVTW
jgi:hypothetical protein